MKQDPERFKYIEDIFHKALSIDQAQRDIYLNEICKTDDDLRHEVESLLAAYHESPFPLNESPLDAVAMAIAEARGKIVSGQMIKSYKISRLLGSGAMGEVYLAEDTILKREVAIKILPTILATDEEKLLRFKQEARTASKLNHPNILTVYEIGQTEEFNYIVTELIDGKTLRQLIKERSLTLPDAIDITKQVAVALNVAHSAGIIHRDIKPENIMVRQDGYVKVLDFGIAKLRKEQQLSFEAERSTAEYYDTPLGIVIGTIPYMSPEQARGDTAK